MTQETINRMIQTGRLKQDFWSLVNHYGCGHAAASVPVVVIYFYLRFLIRHELNESVVSFLVIIGLVGAVLAAILYTVRYKQLRFTIIPTTLQPSEIQRAIDKTAEKWEWRIIENTLNYVYAIQDPDFISGGNRIIIILSTDKVFINSVSFSPQLFFGANVDNVKTLKKNMMDNI